VDHPQDPGRSRTRTCVAADVADLAAVPGGQAPGILACDFLHVDTGTIQRRYGNQALYKH
jgi:hypothetical protein